MKLENIMWEDLRLRDPRRESGRIGAHELMIEEIPHQKAWRYHVYDHYPGTGRVIIAQGLAYSLDRAREVAVIASTSAPLKHVSVNEEK